MMSLIIIVPVGAMLNNTHTRAANRSILLFRASDIGETALDACVVRTAVSAYRSYTLSKGLGSASKGQPASSYSVKPRISSRCLNAKRTTNELRYVGVDCRHLRGLSAACLR